MPQYQLTRLSFVRQQLWLCGQIVTGRIGFQASQGQWNPTRPQTDGRKPRLMDDERYLKDEDRWIEDKAGRHYRLQIAEAGNFWVLKIFDRRVFVGESNCQETQEGLFLSDLRVFEDAKRPEAGIGALALTKIDPPVLI